MLLQRHFVWHAGYCWRDHYEPTFPLIRNDSLSKLSDESIHRHDLLPVGDSAEPLQIVAKLLLLPPHWRLHLALCSPRTQASE